LASCLTLCMQCFAPFWCLVASGPLTLVCFELMALAHQDQHLLAKVGLLAAPGGNLADEPHCLGIAIAVVRGRGVYLFELDADKALASVVPEVKTISKYPAIRRDIAIVVDDNVSAEALIEAVAVSAPDLIRDVRIFDIYRGDRIEAGLKSVAIGLILQETSRTLTDEDADTAMAAAIAALKEKFAAHLRD
ncbi:MAG: hypothetical protein P8X98_13700, partial [Woeseiaceae bacterium]